MKKELVRKVEASLQSIRPYLEADGGDITLVEVTDDFTVRVALHGACCGCHMSHMTMKAGVEGAIKSAVPQIKSVVTVN